MKAKDLLGHRRVTNTQIHHKPPRGPKKVISHKVPICSLPCPGAEGANYEEQKTCSVESKQPATIS